MVSEIMKQAIVSVTPETSITGAARLLEQYNIGALPVCTSNGRLCGILTDRDIVVRCVAAEENPQTMPVRDIMTRSVMSISPDDDLRTATKAMSDGKIRRLPVTDDNGNVAGMLSLGDVANARQFTMEAADALSEICSNIKPF